MRLIDADEFDRFLAGHEFNAAMNECYDADKPFEPIDTLYTTTSFRDVMRHRPTIRPKQGWWEKKEGGILSCSRCGIEYVVAPAVFKFCPECGSRNLKEDDGYYDKTVE